jgi:glutamine synthetase
LRGQIAEEHRATAEAEAEHVQAALKVMNAVRSTADELEGLVADDLWPLATYQEMLFIL